MDFRLNQNQRIAAIRHYYQCGSNATEAITCLNIVVTLLLLSLFRSYCACSSHLSYNKIYLNLQLLLT